MAIGAMPWVASADTQSEQASAQADPSSSSDDTTRLGGHDDPVSAPSLPDPASRITVTSDDEPTAKTVVTAAQAESPADLAPESVITADADIAERAKAVADHARPNRRGLGETVSPDTNQHHSRAGQAGPADAADAPAGRPQDGSTHEAMAEHAADGALRGDSEGTPAAGPLGAARVVDTVPALPGDSPVDPTETVSASPEAVARVSVDAANAGLVPGVPCAPVDDVVAWGTLAWLRREAEQGLLDQGIDVAASAADSYGSGLAAGAAVESTTADSPPESATLGSSDATSVGAAPAANMPTAATGDTSWLGGVPIEPGTSVRKSLDQMTSAELALAAQTWGQLNVVAGLISVVPEILLVQAQLTLDTWQVLNPVAQSFAAITVGIPLVHESTELALSATMLLPSVAQGWLQGAQTIIPLVGILAPGAAATAADLMAQAAENGRVYGVVPLHMQAVTEPVIYISVNGGPSAPVLVDTGSAGLVIDPRYVGQQTPLVYESSGSSAYSGGLTYGYDVYTTTVDFGNGIVTAPTSVDIVSDSSKDAFANYFKPAGVVGVLGIGPNSGGPGPSIPTAALPGELKDGVLIDEIHGVLIFGPNPLPARAAVYGSPVAALDVRIGGSDSQPVWVIVDSGGVYGTVPSYILASGQQSGSLPAQTLVSVYSGSTLLYTYTTTASTSPDVVSGVVMNSGYTPFAQQPIYTSFSGAGGKGTTYFDYA